MFRVVSRFLSEDGLIMEGPPAIPQPLLAGERFGGAAVPSILRQHTATAARGRQGTRGFWVESIPLGMAVPHKITNSSSFTP